MRRLVATLVVGGMLLFGLAPAGADANESACLGQSVSMLVRSELFGEEVHGKILKITADEIFMDVGDVIKIKKQDIVKNGCTPF